MAGTAIAPKLSGKVFWVLAPDRATFYKTATVILYNFGPEMVSRRGFIVYYRVSKSLFGLGIEEQRAAVSTFLIGRNRQVLGEFIEVKDGRRLARPELDKALAAAQLHRVPLVIANLGQLTRSAPFLTRLLEADVDVRFSELPGMEGLTGRRMLRKMAAVAEVYARVTSVQAKVSLAAAKARGKIRGGHRAAIHWAEVRAAGRAAMARKAKAHAAELAPLIAELRAAGITSLSAIASALNARNIATARGRGRWSGMQVKRVLGRL
jgi:DNA invertase Pin-like site-specific DNA recombinase